MAGSNSWNCPLTRLNSKGISQTKHKGERKKERNKMKNKKGKQLKNVGVKEN